MSEQSFTLTSEAFANGEPIPRKYSCEGMDVSPPLNWMHAPPETKSFALIVEDPDAPNGTFTHWVLFNIPDSVARLAEGDRQTGTAGHNDFQGVGYGGPCPPPRHKAHRYYFRLFALDVESLDVQEGGTKAEVLKALDGHVISQTELMGQFARGTSRG